MVLAAAPPSGTVRMAGESGPNPLIAKEKNRHSRRINRGGKKSDQRE
jgi:hypothetical protein